MLIKKEDVKNKFATDTLWQRTVHGTKVLKMKVIVLKESK